MSKRGMSSQIKQTINDQNHLLSVITFYYLLTKSHAIVSFYFVSLNLGFVLRIVGGLLSVCAPGALWLIMYPWLWQTTETETQGYK